MTTGSPVVNTEGPPGMGTVQNTVVSLWTTGSSEADHWGWTLGNHWGGATVLITVKNSVGTVLCTVAGQVRNRLRLLCVSPLKNQR